MFRADSPAFSAVVIIVIVVERPVFSPGVRATRLAAPREGASRRACHDLADPPGLSGAHDRRGGVRHREPLAGSVHQGLHLDRVSVLPSVGQSICCTTTPACFSVNE